MDCSSILADLMVDRRYVKEKPQMSYNEHLRFYCVRLTGLEPAHREILDPKSSASTNSATGASLSVEREEMSSVLPSPSNLQKTGRKGTVFL
jgi:hypothetical protein